MAKYPIRLDLSKIGPKAPKPIAQNRPAPAIKQSDLDRQARRQAMEERSESLLLRRGAPKPGDVISVTTRMRETPTKKKR